MNATAITSLPVNSSRHFDAVHLTEGDMSKRSSGQKSRSAQPKVFMTQPAAKRIQAAADKSGENGAFKGRAMSAAQTHVNGRAIPAMKT